MPISSPQVVKFSNETARPGGDAIYQLYRALVQFQDFYKSADIEALINKEGSGEIVDDGAEGDGRTPITGDDVIFLNMGVNDLVAYMDDAQGKVPLLEIAAKFARK